MVQGFCLKEKKKVEIKDAKFELNAKGRPIARGTCPSCSGKIYKILKTTEVPADLKAKAEAAKAKKGGARKSKSSRKSKQSKSSRKSKQSRKSRKSKQSRKSRKSKSSRGRKH